MSLSKTSASSFGEASPARSVDGSNARYSPPHMLARFLSLVQLYSLNPHSQPVAWYLPTPQGIDNRIEDRKIREPAYYTGNRTRAGDEVKSYP